MRGLEEFPGGKIKDDEKAHEMCEEYEGMISKACYAALRELKEERGLSPGNLEQLYYITEFESNEPLDHRVYVFAAVLNPGVTENDICLSEEHSGWSLSELNKLKGTDRLAALLELLKIT